MDGVHQPLAGGQGEKGGRARLAAAEAIVCGKTLCALNHYD